LQEGRALQADVDECGLHAGQDTLHLAEVDIAHDTVRVLPLDVDVLQDAVFQLRRAGFPGRDINQYLDLQRISAGDGHAAHPEYAGADELFMQGLSAPRTKAASAVCRAGPAWRRMAYCVVGM